MRWHVQGTDVATDRRVELSIDEVDATRAIKAAIDRKIVVSQISPGRYPVYRYLAPIATLLFGAAAIFATALFMQNQGLWSKLEQTQSKLDQTLTEQTQLAASLEQAQSLAADIRSHGSLSDRDSAQVKTMADELASARGKMSLTEQQLTAAHEQNVKFEAAAARVPGLEKDLNSTQLDLADAQTRLRQSDSQAADLRTQLQVQTRRVEELQSQQITSPTSAQKIASLERTNKDLSEQLEKIKDELLLNVAHSTTPHNAATEPAPDPAPVAAALPHWSLRTSYDAAADFLALHSDVETVRQAPSDTDATITSQGVQRGNLSRLSFTHDRAKSRVFEASLSISLAADAPKDKLAENIALVTQFLATFAPSAKDAAAMINTATTQLAGLDPNRRLQFLVDDSRITIWNNREGTFTFKVEPPQ
jgi:myosin heavy subunit